MTNADFLSWLDNEIQEASKFMKCHDKETEEKYWQGAMDAIRCAKEKFLTIQFTSQLTDNEDNPENSFTHGLE